MAKKKDSKCPVTQGEVDLSKYEALDGEWRKVGLAAPARRALVDAKLYKVSDLRKVSLSELTEKTTGAALPIDALFQWLQGVQASAHGWQADLSSATQGVVTARRITPLPEVTLRIKLD